MTDIVEFLTARLDEDEAAAVRAARPEPWVKPQPSRPDWYVQFWADERDRAAVIADPESSAYPIVTTLGYDGNDETDEELAEGRVDHIARHDPARVLAEVAAKRQRLALYVEVTDVLFHGGSGDRIKYQRESGRFEALDVEVRRDAAIYAEHPDYKQGWQVG